MNSASSSSLTKSLPTRTTAVSSSVHSTIALISSSATSDMHRPKGTSTPSPAEGAQRAAGLGSAQGVGSARARAPLAGAALRAGPVAGGRHAEARPARQRQRRQQQRRRRRQQRQWQRQLRRRQRQRQLRRQLRRQLQRRRHPLGSSYWKLRKALLMVKPATSAASSLIERSFCRCCCTSRTFCATCLGGRGAGTRRASQGAPGLAGPGSCGAGGMLGGATRPAADAGPRAAPVPEPPGVVERHLLQVLLAPPALLLAARQRPSWREPPAAGGAAERRAEPSPGRATHAKRCFLSSRALHSSRYSMSSARQARSSWRKSRDAKVSSPDSITAITSERASALLIVATETMAAGRCCWAPLVMLQGRDVAGGARSTDPFSRSCCKCSLKSPPKPEEGSPREGASAQEEMMPIERERGANEPQPATCRTATPQLQSLVATRCSAPL
jgi:hypothetical protein